MEVVDSVETQGRVEKLTEEQKDDLFTDLIKGKDVIEEIETSRGRFTVKFQKAADILAIGKLTAARRGYKPPDAFDSETEMINVMASTLDVVVVSGPKWYEDAKIKDKNFSFMEAPSRIFLMEFYGKVYSFREKVEASLNPQEGAANKPVFAEDGDDDAMGSDLLEGIADKPNNKRT